MTMTMKSSKSIQERMLWTSPRILSVKEQYKIEAINIDDEYEGHLILQIDLRTEEEHRLEEETTEILKESEK